jgi:hypothetical protein
MKLTLKNLREQKVKWRPHGRNDHTWVFSYINDKSKVDVQIPQVMCYMLCYEKLISYKILEQITRLRKRISFIFQE